MTCAPGADDGDVSGVSGERACVRACSRDETSHQ